MTSNADTTPEPQSKRGIVKPALVVLALVSGALFVSRTWWDAPSDMQSTTSATTVAPLNTPVPATGLEERMAMLEAQLKEQAELRTSGDAPSALTQAPAAGESASDYWQAFDALNTKLLLGQSFKPELERLLAVSAELPEVAEAASALVMIEVVPSPTQLTAEMNRLAPRVLRVTAMPAEGKRARWIQRYSGNLLSLRKTQNTTAGTADHALVVLEATLAAGDARAIDSAISAFDAPAREALAPLETMVDTRAKAFAALDAIRNSLKRGGV